jgi:2-dehydropantoate 2-reductase
MFRRTNAIAPYKTSNLVDYDAGRQLEIEAIWGVPLRRVEEAGVAAPRLG